jgi:hypothetical protein
MNPLALWIHKVIDSCITLEQLTNTQILIENYLKMNSFDNGFHYLKYTFENKKELLKNAQQKKRRKLKID